MGAFFSWWNSNVQDWACDLKLLSCVASWNIPTAQCWCDDFWYTHTILFFHNMGRKLYEPFHEDQPSLLLCLKERKTNWRKFGSHLIFVLLFPFPFPLVSGDHKSNWKKRPRSITEQPGKWRHQSVFGTVQSDKPGLSKTNIIPASACWSFLI